jgi:hypothetical protein
MLVFVVMIVSIIMQVLGLAILFGDLLPSDINSLYGGCTIAAGALLSIWCLLTDDDD